ncbi:hypothetical protein [Actinacidiphila acididurans]|uniref:Uncharacterized protein n=1 Tax=Actinacidiphila acididurans TaxID=2784346 RepID=A0ABS2U321_9ACTN|nr:hypothetical protein [Actinacidiphila acididurans]MBM9509999.1 hypothetical protein [Actinacidiphila acididurans]
MSDTTEMVQYQISGSAGNASNSDGISITLTSQAGATDAVALAVAEAIRGIVWAPGVTCSVAIFKSVMSTTSWSGDLTSNPPTFV